LLPKLLLVPLVLMLWGALQSALAFGGELVTAGHAEQLVALGVFGVASGLVVTWARRYTQPRDRSTLDHWGDTLRKLRAIDTGS